MSVRAGRSFVFQAERGARGSRQRAGAPVAPVHPVGGGVLPLRDPEQPGPVDPPDRRREPRVGVHQFLTFFLRRCPQSGRVVRVVRDRDERVQYRVHRIRCRRLRRWPGIWRLDSPWNGRVSSRVISGAPEELVAHPSPAIALCAAGEALDLYVSVLRVPEGECGVGASGLAVAEARRSVPDAVVPALDGGGDLRRGGQWRLVGNRDGMSSSGARLRLGLGPGSSISHHGRADPRYEGAKWASGDDSGRGSFPDQSAPRRRGLVSDRPRPRSSKKSRFSIDLKTELDAAHERRGALTTLIETMREQNQTLLIRALPAATTEPRRSWRDWFRRRKVMWQ